MHNDKKVDCRIRSAFFTHSMLVVQLWLTFVLIICVLPINSDIAPFPQFDKLVHATLYALPAAYLTYVRHSSIRYFLYLIGFGIFIEIVQFFLPYRSADIWDVCANSFGVFLGWSTVHIICRR